MTKCMGCLYSMVGCCTAALGLCRCGCNANQPPCCALATHLNLPSFDVTRRQRIRSQTLAISTSHLVTHFISQRNGVSRASQQ